MNLATVFLQTLDTTLPVFAMVFLGIGLKRLGWIDDRFISTASLLVFRATMPTLVFLSIIQADLSTAFLPWLIVYFMAGTVGGFLLIWLWAAWRVPEAQRGVYVQGAFRGNNGIVGLALAANIYGDWGLSAGGILMGATIIVYNILAVIVLSAYAPDQSTSVRSIFRSIVSNPLVISVVAAIPVAASGLTLPSWLLKTGHYFAGLSLPLALICIGGTLSLGALYQARAMCFGASMIKMLVFPAVTTALAWLWGFTGRELGMLFLFFGCPGATSSFVMVQAMGGDAKLAANIIAVTTLAASVIMTLWLFSLRSLGAI